MLEGQAVGKPGITALALLAYFSRGYSHLSQDSWNGRNIGALIRSSLDWILRDQQADGTFLSGTRTPLDQILAALALSEAYGRTRAPQFKEPAQNAMMAVLRSQGLDGGWGGPGPTSWGMEVLLSGRDAGLIPASEVGKRALLYQPTESHSGDLYRRLITERRDSLSGLVSAMLASPPGPKDFASWYHASRSIRCFGGRHGDTWQKWSKPLLATWTTGTWPGVTHSQTVVQSSLALQILLMHYDPSPAVFGPPSH